MDSSTFSEDRFLQVFRDVFQNPGLDVHDSTTAADVVGWDSFHHVQLIVALEDTFDIRFTTKEIAGLQRVSDIKDVVRARVSVQR